MSKDKTKDAEISKKADTKSIKTSKKSSKKDEKKLSFFKKVVKYFKDLKSEFKKVVWPTKIQVFNNTLVVLVTMCVVGLFVFGLDTAFLKLLGLAFPS